MTEPPLVAGETLIDFVPDSGGPLSAVETFHRRAGGAPANVAVGLARLDRTPQLWTRIANDAFGEFLAERLAREGLLAAVNDDAGDTGGDDTRDTDRDADVGRLIDRDAEAKTTLAFVSRDVEDPRFSFYREGTADTRFEQGRVPDDLLAETPWVHAGGVTLATEPARSATLDLLERADDAGCTVSFDPNVRPELWANDAELATVCGWAFEATDVLIATPEELETLGWSGDGPESLARAAIADGPHTVVSTLGEAGSMAVGGEGAPWPGVARHDGYHVDAVDDTGAGDAFTAGLIDALVEGVQANSASDSATDGESTRLVEALAFANAVAALSTTERGAMEALPEREAVTSLLEAH